MEATVVSIGKSVLVGALGYARSKAAEEVSLQLGVEGDVAFIADELEMMQSFLMAANGERGQRKVLVTWVKHVRDLAYNVEDSLMDFSLLSEKSKSWWRSLRTAGERRRVAKEIKDLRAKVEDVSNRNLRYRLIDDSSGSKPTVAEEQASIATAALFGINETRLAALEHEKSSEVDLLQLITGNSVDLRVMAVWGTSGELGKTSAIQEVYDDPKVLKRFEFRAWIRLMHPFNPKEFLRNLVWQFYENSVDGLGNEAEGTSIGANVLMKMESMEQDVLVHVFNAQVRCNSYLVVIDDLSTIVEWHCIQKYFPNNKKQSRIIVSTQQVEIASLCTEKPYQVSELKQLSCDQTLYVFHKKDSVEQVSMATPSAAMSNINEARFAAMEKEKSKNSVEPDSMASASATMFNINEARLAAMEKQKPKAMHVSCSVNAISNSNNVTTEKNTEVTTSEIQEEEQEPKNAGEDKVCNSTARKKFDCSRTLPLVDEVLCGRELEKSIVIELLGQADNNQYYKTSEDQVSMASATGAVFETSGERLATMEMGKLKISEEQVSIASASAAVFLTNEASLASMEREKLMVMHAPCSVEPIHDTNKATTAEIIAALPSSEMQEEYQQPKNADEDKLCNLTSGKKFDRSRTVALDDDVGRETEKSVLIRLVGQPDDNQGCKVISIWGMGGLGKTTLARSVYQCQQLGDWKRAWATALCPFNPEVLLRNLVSQLQKSIQEDPSGATATREQKKRIAVMKLDELKEVLARLLNTQKCVVVLDDISSTVEWDLVKGCLKNAGRIIVTTRDKNIAIHCSIDHNNMYSLEGLKEDAALDLFIKKVFKDKTEKSDLVPAMMEQARLVLKKCDGLPLAISTIGGFLSTKPKTAIEWRKMNDCLSAELEINPELRTIKAILMRSYDGLPYHLKSAFLYLSIYPEDHRIRWVRLVRRWIAEGYSRDMHGMTAEELGRRYFDELLDRSMILPGEGVTHSGGKISSCQLHDIIREICISKAREENLVFTLEDGCCLNNTQGPVRHLVVGSNWKRDKDVLMSMLDLSHVRSLTVFGEWRSFLISDNMRFLRVLDLEDTAGLQDHHLDQIGQLLHLKYLSLRKCGYIYRLPNSLGNLRYLQVLDVRGTHIFEFPSTISKLRKLQHIHAADGKRDYTEEQYDMNHEHNSYLAHFMRRGSCGRLMSTGRALLRPQIVSRHFNWSDVVNLHRFLMADYRSDILRHVIYDFGLDIMVCGVQIPRGFGKLKTLQTLHYVNIAYGKGKVALKELKELTQLHKLGVFGVTPENSMTFWSAIAGHNQLRSLSVEALDYYGKLDGCLGEGLSPPSCLESLKLTGELIGMTAWIHQLQVLSKLTLKRSMLEQDDAIQLIQALGVLPNLAVLRLNFRSFEGGQLHFQKSSFRSLLVLKLNGLFDLESVLFEEDAMPRLELLQIPRCPHLKQIFGLPVLTSLREIRLGCQAHEFSEVFIKLEEDVRRQVAEHLEHVRVNMIT